MESYKDIIKINPLKRFGHPCVRDTRSSVYDMLAWLSKGMSNAEIIEDSPELTETDINACLENAADRERTVQVAFYFKYAVCR
ncbi:DUF433 domain-containing protein [Persicitalea jodogahamensis]|uniref:DUF433 domain-containing protein n=1 Tax=Persicitalea jodogahamensis TaxID=402147 RepID=A0A8J3D8U3_9BACT|nr:DUF433 domain-containing protein [Persicitalea jodogahamensis]GHB67558.1 hypothetical protein GCM10007390_21080 [Persicitalea jodogahamensis]